MAENTAISWTDATWSPWEGCVKISPACDHCYAERDAKRFAPAKTLWGVDSERRVFSDKPDGSNKHWGEPLRWARQPFCECMQCGWRGTASKAGVKNSPPGFDRDPGAMRTCPQCQEPLLKESRARVFCASMGDWLDLDAPIGEFVRLLDLIRKTLELDWLLLSKRIGNWKKRLQEAWDYLMRGTMLTADENVLAAWIERWLAGEAPTNVWVLATVVTQEEADRDIVKLLAVPARIRGLSIEPMLSAINLHPWLCKHGDASKPEQRMGPWCDANDALHWIIAGGESGPHARPTEVSWLRGVVEQCKAAGVPVHVKQLGAQPRGWCAARVHCEPADDEPLTEHYCDFYEAHEQRDPCPGRCPVFADKAGRDPAEWPDDLRVQEFPA